MTTLDDDQVDEQFDGSPLLCLDRNDQHFPHTWRGHGGVAYRCSGDPVDDDQPWPLEVTG